MPSSLQVLTSTTGKKTDCWNTPEHLVKDIIEFFGTIDLDPCSNSTTNPNIPANQYYTEDTDGLAHPWLAKSVFMNHPYSNSKEWIPYAVSQYELGNSQELLLLIKLDVSTKWWKSVSNYPWLAINTRLKFGNAASAAPFQSAIVYLGSDLLRFEQIFKKYGTIYVPHSSEN